MENRRALKSIKGKIVTFKILCLDSHLGNTSLLSGEFFIFNILKEGLCLMGSTKAVR